MNYDWSHFHKGHNRIITPHAGKSLATCLDCGVSADLEAISAKISPADSLMLEAKATDRTSIGQLSEGIAYRGYSQ
jgi:hypothetical protein